MLYLISTTLDLLQLSGFINHRILTRFIHKITKAIMTTLPQRIWHNFDLEFTIVAKIHQNKVEYIIYNIEGYAQGDSLGVFDRPMWHKAGDNFYPSAVDTLEEAEPYLHGHVKRDGCSDWYFDEQDRSMLHGCCREDIQRFGDVMAACWDWTAELLEGFNPC